MSGLEELLRADRELRRRPDCPTGAANAFGMPELPTTEAEMLGEENSDENEEG
jgi:hypothetical protein